MRTHEPDKKYLIKGGRVVDPANKTDGIFDIFISGGKIVKIEKDIKEKCDETIDAAGKIVAPGLVDMHTHLREPGREDKETVASGTRAAVRGGYTSIACMPNTEPTIDSPQIIKQLEAVIKKDALINVFIIGAATRGRAGKELTDFEKLKAEGIVAVSDDGSSIESEKLMTEAMKEAKRCGLVVIEHCEDVNISAGGVINRGFVSTKMGLHGIPKEAEYERVKRDIDIAGKTGGRLHIAHVSCKESVELIRKAKKDSINVTAEAAPHHFSLTEACCAAYDTNMKMNPPLRTKADVEEIKNGLADGTIDAIATDHAPHTDSEKDVEFDYAPFGIIGLETALSLGVMELVEQKALSWPELISKMSANPARILGINIPGIEKGKTADIVIIDPAKEYIYKKDTIESRSKNSPFIGWTLKARVTDVFVSGRAAMRNEVML